MPKTTTKKTNAPKGFVRRNYKNPAKAGATVLFENNQQPFYIRHQHSNYVVGFFLKEDCTPDIYPGFNDYMIHDSEVKWVKLVSDHDQVKEKFNQITSDW